MRAVYNKKTLSLLLVLLISNFSFTFAQEVKSKELAFNFSFFNFFESSEKEKTDNMPVPVKEAKENLKKEENKIQKIKEVKNTKKKTTLSSCENFDSTTEKLLNLETSSASAKEKIENVEETINNEEAVRDSIFYSVKNLLGLQKKDKVIFREMRKDLNEAKSYYNDLDEKINETNKTLSESNCENMSLESAEKIANNTEDLVQDEDTFRKQFVGSLKEKMKILQDGVKEAKK